MVVKQVYKTMVISLISLIILYLGCGNKRTDLIKNGYLKAFGDEVTIGEILKVVAGNEAMVNWESKELLPTELEYEKYYLVEANWSVPNSNLASNLTSLHSINGTAPKSVTIQFMVKNDGTDFRLHGSIINGEFINAFATVLAVKKAYNEKN